MPKLVGHAALFNTPTPIWSTIGHYTEVLAPGCFSRALREGDDCRALWNHDPNYVLGRSSAGTLKLAEDATGLAVEIVPPDTQWVRDLLESVRRRDVSGMSFGFIPVPGKSERLLAQPGDTTDTIIRREVRILDVSLATYPATPETSVYVRSNADAQGAIVLVRQGEVWRSHTAATVAVGDATPIATAGRARPLPTVPEALADLAEDGFLNQQEGETLERFAVRLARYEPDAISLARSLGYQVGELATEHRGRLHGACHPHDQKSKQRNHSLSHFPTLTPHFSASNLLPPVRQGS